MRISNESSAWIWFLCSGGHHRHLKDHWLWTALSSSLPGHPCCKCTLPHSFHLYGEWGQRMTVKGFISIIRINSSSRHVLVQRFVDICQFLHASVFPGTSNREDIVNTWITYTYIVLNIYIWPHVHFWKHNVESQRPDPVDEMCPLEGRSHTTKMLKDTFCYTCPSNFSTANYLINLLVGVLYRTQGSAVASGKLFGWAVLQRAGSGNDPIQRFERHCAAK